jgi:DNA-binding transcriptional LysR family regulator
MLDLSGLQHFLSVARSNSLVLAAEELSLSPSAVSKSIKRLEQSLKTHLFDRTGRALRLNAEGLRLLGRAQVLLNEAEKLKVDFVGEDYRVRCRFTGPSGLLLRYAQALSEKLISRYPRASVVYTQSGERDALSAVSRGEAEFALVSETAMRYADAKLKSEKLGSSEFKVAISPQHRLFKPASRKPVAIEKVLEHDFVTPVNPMFVGLEQTANDGWRDDVFARKIRYRSDDILLVKNLIDSGQALAYLPDFLIQLLGLHVLRINGCPYRCLQEMLLVYSPGAAFGWMRWLVESHRSKIKDSEFQTGLS